VCTRPLERFRRDLQKRFPEQPNRARSREDEVDVVTTPETQPTAHARLRKLPPEIGILLLVIGTAGVLLPGPVGSPFLVAGGLALWPSGFRGVDRCFMKLAPRMYEKGVRQIEYFLADLERRYPGSVC
jgi:hypothetical protein